MVPKSARRPRACRHGLDHQFDADRHGSRQVGGPHYQARASGSRRKVGQYHFDNENFDRNVALGVNCGQSCSAPTRNAVAAWKGKNATHLFARRYTRLTTC
jgi:hypothetical protein